MRADRIDSINTIHGDGIDNDQARYAISKFRWPRGSKPVKGHVGKEREFRSNQKSKKLNRPSPSRTQDQLRPTKIVPPVPHTEQWFLTPVQYTIPLGHTQDRRRMGTGVIGGFELGAYMVKGPRFGSSTRDCLLVPMPMPMPHDKLSASPPACWSLSPSNSSLYVDFRDPHVSKSTLGFASDHLDSH